MILARLEGGGGAAPSSLSGLGARLGGGVVHLPLAWMKVNAKWRTLGVFAFPRVFFRQPLPGSHMTGTWGLRASGFRLQFYSCSEIPPRKSWINRWLNAEHAEGCLNIGYFHDFDPFLWLCSVNGMNLSHDRLGQALFAKVKRPIGWYTQNAEHTPVPKLKGNWAEPPCIWWTLMDQAWQKYSLL